MISPAPVRFQNDALELYPPLFGSTQHPATTVASSPRFLLIDDDPIFCKRMQRLAEQHEVSLSVFSSVESMESEGAGARYDVALVDYYLEHSTAAEVIPKLQQTMPVVLISEAAAAVIQEGNLRPESIQSFVPKSRGTGAIMAEAFNAMHRLRIRRSVAIPETETKHRIQDMEWFLESSIVFATLSIFVFALFS